MTRQDYPLTRFPRVLLFKPGARHLQERCDCGEADALMVGNLARCAGCRSPIMPVHVMKRESLWRVLARVVQKMTMRKP